MWNECKNSLPIEDGYYYTYYFNTQYDGYYYKAIAWYKQKWVFWKKFEIEPTVIAYIPESRNDYYTSCEMEVEKTGFVPYKS